MLELGPVKSSREFTERENIDNSYVSRMVNLTSLSPDIVEAILDDLLFHDSCDTKISQISNENKR